MILLTEIPVFIDVFNKIYLFISGFFRTLVEYSATKLKGEIIMEQRYKFNKWDFDENGTNTKDGVFFLDLIGEWEQDFHDRYFPFYSNYLFGNVSTMILIKNCFDFDPNEDCGMELINGKIDLDTNLKIEEYSKRQTTYAIGSNLDQDEPMFLVIDDSMVDGMVILKYVPDSRGSEVSPEVPVETENLKASLTKR